MIPSVANSDFPIFVPDQVLTSDNLNDLFGYLDEQDRISRTNLLGIGIVCGLQVSTGSDMHGLYISISNGCGITSQGYLVTMGADPEIKYHHYNKFDALKCRYYEPFVNIAGKTQIIPLWELKQFAEVTDDAKNPMINLDSPVNFLNDMVVMIFVELLETNNKNCDPDSCDDKGTKVTVNFRPLLVSKTHADTLIKTKADAITAGLVNSLPDIFMRRWDVTTTNPVKADDIFNGYKKILSQNFIVNVQSVLSQAYAKFFPVIRDEYPTDPFAGFNLVTTFSFLYNGTISSNQSVHLQYYFDLFADLVEAYNEFCKTGNEIISTCCPDETLFPRHLLLGEAIPLANDTLSKYRHYFMYSPLFQRKDLLRNLRLLFRRMDLMLKNFHIPAVASSGPASNDALIKINPSVLCANHLSYKAIPYYYQPNVNPKPLYKFWNAEKLSRGREQQILSYNSNDYNITDDFVINPLTYDLETYNFFRVEGITGKNVSSVLTTIKNRIDNFRLPVQVVALATGNPIKNPGKKDECCNFSDFELQYQLLRKELLCCLKGNISYWGAFVKRDDGKGNIYYEHSKAAYGDMVMQMKEMPVEKTVTEMAKAPQNDTGDLLNIRTQMKMGVMAATKKTENVVVIDKLFSKNVGNTMPESMARKYMDYQGVEHISMGSLPIPKTNTPDQTMPYFILVIIDEMEVLVNLLSKENIDEFDAIAYGIHSAKLDDAASKLAKLLSAYHSTEYLVEKIRINAGQQHNADVDAIALAMQQISNSDAYNIILLLLNMSATTDFVAQIKRNSGNYVAQQAVITAFLAKLDKDGMMIPIIKEPDANYVSKYGPVLDHLKYEMCTCNLDKLKYLLQSYKDLYDKLSDLNNFSVYAKSHPGLQHKAGVITGGTFIIVYKGTNDPRQDIKANTVIADFYIPYTCCSDCTPVQVVINEPPPPLDIPPVAKAGDDITIQLPANKVTLDGTSSIDPDGTIKTYLWKLKTGPAQFAIVNKDAATTDVNNLVEGEYIFTLTVTDNDGLSATDDVKITVLPMPNKPPVSNAGPDQALQILQNGQVTVPGTVQLDGSLSSDPDGTITNYSWAKVSGPAQGIISTPNAVKTTVSGLLDGVYVIELTVTDNKGATGKSQVIITVTKKINLPPIANSGQNMVITLPVNNIQLDGSASSDPDGTITAFKWVKLNGPVPGNFNDPSIKNPIFSGMTEGVYVFELTVTDNLGLTGKSQVVITVNKKINLPPVANAGPDQTIQIVQTTAALILGTVQLDGTKSSDSDGTIVSFAWAKISGPASGIIASPNTSKTMVTALASGVYGYELTVTDDQGGIGKSQVKITVMLKIDLPPQKACAPLVDIITQFSNLKAVDTATNFKNFSTRYTDYKAILELYNDMQAQGIAAKTVNEQISYFVSKQIDKLLPVWIDDLRNIVMEFANFRLLSLSMLNIHAQMAYYLACIQKEDVNKPPAPMEKALDSLTSLLDFIKQSVANFSPEQKALLKALLGITITEKNRVSTNGEQAAKLIYLDKLNKIIEILNSMGL